MEREKANYRVIRICQVLGVSLSGYYAWRQRGPSRRTQRDVQLLERIRTVYAKSRGIYGAPRVYAELRCKQGVYCSRKRVTRLMREAGLVGVHRRRKQGSTRRDPVRPSYADLVKREFTPDTPDRLWVADITQHMTDEGWLCLAVVIDAYSRKVVRRLGASLTGWSMAEHLQAELVVKALEMAVWNRQPSPGLIHPIHIAELQATAREGRHPEIDGHRR